MPPTNRVPLINLFVHMTLVLLFFVSAFLLITLTNGYLFNPNTVRFEQTGIVNITSDQAPISVSVNGKKKEHKKSPVNLMYLVPGYYTVAVEKDNYLPWSRSFYLQSGEVQLNPSIELFLADSTVTSATQAQTLFFQANARAISTDPDFDIRGNEIWVTPITRTYPFTITSDTFSLIARFTHPIDYAIWYRGKTNILFQIDNQIREIDRDGTNDHVLVTLKTATPTQFLLMDNGRTLVYKDGDQIMQRKLQD